MKEFFNELINITRFEKRRSSFNKSYILQIDPNSLNQSSWNNRQIKQAVKYYFYCAGKVL